MYLSDHPVYREIGRIRVRGDQHCERNDTVAPATAAPWRRTVVLALGLVLAACGGGKGADRYAQATNAQELCCENVAGSTRAQCLANIVKAPDPSIAATDVNQATFACVMDHFVCDPTSGHATQASAQAQLDCIQDLP